MRILGIVLLSIVALVVICAGLGYWYLVKNFPNVGPTPTVTIAATSEMLERGKYLAEHVCGCVDCHSTRDWSCYAAPVIPGTEGKGGFVFDKAMLGIPGSLHAANITPSGIGDYTDGELYRAITTGVKKDGSAMFPMMPYLSFGKMDDEDIKAIIAYIRTLAPIENKVPASALDFPMNLIVRMIPQPAEPHKRPDTSNQVAYGAYLVGAAACFDCHTPIGDKGMPVPGMEFAGGMEFHWPTGFVARAANITPDSATGIGSWTKERFIAAFKAYATEEGSHRKIDSTDFNTPMPWAPIGGMTEQDLGAIYTFLRNVKPVSHTVVKFERQMMASH